MEDIVLDPSIKHIKTTFHREMCENIPTIY